MGQTYQEWSDHSVKKDYDDAYVDRGIITECIGNMDVDRKTIVDIDWIEEFIEYNDEYSDENEDTGNREINSKGNKLLSALQKYNVGFIKYDW